MNSLRTDILRTHAGLGGMLGGLLVLAATSTALAQEKPGVVNVDCTQGETISRAASGGQLTGPCRLSTRPLADR